MTTPGEVPPPAGNDPAVPDPDGSAPDWPYPPAYSPPAWPVLLGAALVVVAGGAVLGLPFGLVWSWLAPDVPIRVVAEGLAYGQTQPEQPVAADGWFALLAIPVGMVVAAVTWLVRPLRGNPGLFAVAFAGVAAALVGWWLGRQVGLAGYQAALDAAEPGTLLSRPPDLQAFEASWLPPRLTGVLLVPSLAAAVTYTLLAAWSRFPSLHRP